MIDEYGSFTPIESTLENLKKQVSEFAQIAMINFDSTKASLLFWPIKSACWKKLTLEKSLI